MLPAFLLVALRGEITPEDCLCSAVRFAGNTWQAQRPIFTFDFLLLTLKFFSLMKRFSQVFGVMAVSAIILFACKGGTKHEQPADTDNNTGAATAETASAGNASSPGFDINSVPVSGKDLGAFPFFSFPEGLDALNKPVQKKFDRVFFPINGVMTPLEGRLWVPLSASKPAVPKNGRYPFLSGVMTRLLRVLAG
ncbi:MAG: hypothetical protein QM664_11350 [Flavihumibacter sp.]